MTLNIRLKKTVAGMCQEVRSKCVGCLLYPFYIVFRIIYWIINRVHVFNSFLMVFHPYKYFTFNNLQRYRINISNYLCTNPCDYIRYFYPISSPYWNVWTLDFQVQSYSDIHWTCIHTHYMYTSLLLLFGFLGLGG